MNNDENKPEEQPQYFLHESENFNSLYFGKLPEQLASKKDPGKAIPTLVALLTDPRNKSMRHEVLTALKNAGAAEIMVTVLRMKEYKAHRQNITAACWESGLDFSDFLDDFITLAIQENYETAMEAMTVIEEMPGPFEAPELDAAAARITATDKDSEEKTALLNALKSILDTLPRA